MPTYCDSELRGSAPPVHPRPTVYLLQITRASRLYTQSVSSPRRLFFFCFFSLVVMSFEALQLCIVPASSPQTSMQHVICAEPRGSAQPEHPRLGITHMYGLHESLSLVQHVSAGSRLRCCTPNSGGHGRPVRPSSHSECAPSEWKGVFVPLPAIPHWEERIESPHTLASADTVPRAIFCSW